MDYINRFKSAKQKKETLQRLEEGKIDIIIGTHSLFQEKTLFQNLGLIIIDEQHKFGVQQRINLSLKGNINTDVLLMTATPIPRTLILTNYGDMDISTLKTGIYVLVIETKFGIEKTMFSIKD